MQNFTLHTPTKVLFGEGQIANLRNEVPENARILITYGGGSVKTHRRFGLGSRSAERFTRI